MKKITTLFKKDSNDLSRVINEINPENFWVINGEAIATRKFDGTAAAIINGSLFKRFDAKNGKNIPKNAISCQDPDLITGHHPHWVKCIRENKEDQYFFQAFDELTNKDDGTYELCGEKVQNNPEKITGHKLIKHGCEILQIIDYSFEGLKRLLSDPNLDIEGLVFHHKTDGRMCKIRKKDFQVKRSK